MKIKTFNPLIYYIGFILSFCFVGCDSTNELKGRCNTVKEYAIENNIYDSGLIYISTNDSFNKIAEYPNLKLFNSEGVMMNGGNCMSNLYNLVNKLNKDSISSDFFYYHDSISLKAYLNWLKLIDVSTQEKYSLDNQNSKTQFYLFYCWTKAFQYFLDKNEFAKLISQMKTSALIAQKKGVKIFYIHTP